MRWWPFPRPSRWPSVAVVSARGASAAQTRGTKRHAREPVSTGPASPRSIRTSRCPPLPPTGSTIRPRRRAARRAPAHLLGRRRDRDRVERRAVGRAEAAVADSHLDGAVPGQLERPPRAGGQHGDPLDRDDPAGELVEHRRRVAGAGADVEHALAAVELEELAHRRDDERLGDRLVLADRERRVVVRVRGDLDRDERLTGDAPHRGQHALVGDPPATELSLDHTGSGPPQSGSRLPITRRGAPRTPARRRRSARARRARRPRRSWASPSLRRRPR